MNRKKKLAILAGCMVMCAAGFGAVARAEEAAEDADIQMEEVVVTAARFKALNPVKFTTITAEDIKAKGAQNVAEVLNDVTGLYINSNSTKGKHVAQFRGSDADNTKVFVDGVPLSPVGDGRVDLRNIPADNIAKIEVIKGAVPVIYGTDAPGGVIYITTKKAGNTTASSLSITTGTDNDEKYYFSLDGRKGKLSYDFGVKRDETAGYTHHSRAEANYFNGKLNWDLNPRSSLTLFGSYTRRQEQVPNRIDPATGDLLLNNGQGGSIVGPNNFWRGTYDGEYDPIKNSYMGLLYSWKLNTKSDLSLRFYQSKEDSSFSAQGWAENEQAVSHTAYQYWDGTVRGWELQHTVRTSPVNTATWGYNHETRGFTEQTTMLQSFGGNNPANYNYFGEGKYDYTGKSFYLQDTTQVNRRLATSFGYRHYEIKDHADIDTIAYDNPGLQHGVGTADDPVFSVNYALSSRVNLHGSVGKSFRWPNAKERSGPGGIYGAPTETVTQGGVTTGNGLGPNGLGYLSTYLEPEEAVNRELGVGYTAHGFKFDVTFFSRDITNMIKGQGFGQHHTQYYNIPHVDMEGYELEVNKNIRNGLKAFFNYTYTDAYDPLAGGQVRDVPKQKYSLGLNYAGADGVNANLAFNYLGSRVSAFSNGNGNGSGDKPQVVRVHALDSYYTVDLKIGKTEENQEYYVRILNLFDKQFYNGAYLVGPGRYIEVGTTIKF